FNASKAYIAQLDKTEKYEGLQPVYVLSFVNDIYDRTPETGGEYYHRYALMHEGHPGRRIEGIELIFVELPKFKPQRRAEKKFEQLWLLFLTAINDTTQEPPKELLATKETKKALDCLERAAYTPGQLRTYDGYWDAIRLERSRSVGMFDAGLAKGKALGIEKGKAEGEALGIEKGLAEGEAIGIAKGKAEGEAIGIEKGKAEGLAEGEANANLTHARKMKAKGFSPEDIADITGISLAQLRRL
ncbi:MAG: PD-(D/E)XK nuclease family transposase, partial [Opitutaceae bacterium]|nr:PD-(D/E)XK nuclease family transposase [Opitutaceae bacterium]